MHIRVMTDPQAYLKTTGGGSGGAANTELARQLITGKLSAESQIAKALRVFNLIPKRLQFCYLFGFYFQFRRSKIVYIQIDRI